MRSGDLIETTCGANVAPVPVPFNVDTIDRYGNSLPTIIISADQTINWKARDYRDNYLSRLTATNATKETAINNLCDSLVAAGLMGKFPHLFPLIGDNATDNSLNLAYPFSKYSNEIRWGGSPTHGLGKVQGNGTTAYGFLPVSPYDMDSVNFSMGAFRLNAAIPAANCYVMGWGDANNGAWLFYSSAPAGGSVPSFNNTNYYSRLTYAAEGDNSGLVVGDVSATSRRFLRNGVVKAQSAATLGLTKNHYGIFLLTCSPGGGYTTDSLSFAFVGETLSATEHVNLSTIINQFNADKGALFI